MTYTYIDDDAVPALTSDGYLAAPLAHRVRDNLAQSWDERGPRCGIMLPNGLRMFSPFVTSYGPYPLHLPVGEQFDHVEVHLYISSVEWSASANDTPAGGSDACWLAASLIYDDGNYDHPPDDIDDWDALCDATLPLTTTASAQIVTLTAPMRRRTGAVGALIWYVSAMNSTAEYTSRLAIGLSAPNDRIELDGALPYYTTNPVERGCTFNVLSQKTPTQIGTQVGPMALINTYQVTSTAKHIVTTCPPIMSGGLDVILTADYPFYIWTGGVAEITGIEVEAIPASYSGPDATAFNIGAEVDEDGVGQLIQTANHIVHRRTRSAHTGYMTWEGLYWVPWAFFAAGLPGTFNDILTTSTSNIHDTVVFDTLISRPSPSADRVGWGAHIYWVAVGDAEYVSAWRLYWQITMEESGTSSPTIYCNSSGGYNVNAGATHGFDTTWEPITQTLARSVLMTSRGLGPPQSRGMLIDPHQAGLEGHGEMTDIGLVQHAVVELDEDSVTYPASLKIRAKSYIPGDTTRLTTSSEVAILAVCIYERLA